MRHCGGTQRCKKWVFKRDCGRDGVVWLYKVDAGGRGVKVEEEDSMTMVILTLTTHKRYTPDTHTRYTPDTNDNHYHYHW
jgi:hypothetical protein